MNQNAVEHLKNLIRIDTSNPPGNEEEAIKYLKSELEQNGFEVFIQPTARNRANLVTRLKGNGEKKPFLLNSHVDVVKAEADKWTHPPFAAVEDAGYIYGRGTIDMKNFTTMCLMTMLKAKQENWPLKRDLIMTAVADEEQGCKFGMRRLVEDCPDLVNAEYGLGEVGAYTTYVAGKPLYPIQAGEKSALGVKITFHGKPGHGSLPARHNVHWQLGRFLSALERGIFLYHPTPAFRHFSDAMREVIGPTKGLVFKALGTPIGPRLLKELYWRTGDKKFAAILAMMTNTANPSMTESGVQVNVLPSEASITLDCRLIPGVTGKQFIQELKDLTRSEFTYEILYTQHGHLAPVDTDLFRHLCQKIEVAHPGSRAIPWLNIGYTDAGELQKVRTIIYGFTPVKLPPDVDFAQLYHGHDERIPVEGFLWGNQLLQETVKEFCCR